jgi:hypothetical protein
MYKPNGEEPMTKQEEMLRKSAAAERKVARSAGTAPSEVLRTAFYAALFRSSVNRQTAVEAAFETTRQTI